MTENYNLISAKCVISAVGPNRCPDTGYPEIVMVGRSNVGKSSLINSLCARRALARTSRQPGKTQTINYFAINEQMYLVDLPGYGYAETLKGKHREWGEFITNYLRNGDRIALIVHLIDLRHEPMKNDKNASEWLMGLNIPYVIVGTKADKISRGKRPAHIAAIRKGLMLPAHVPALIYSSETGEGRDELWHHVRSVISGQE
ncbi:MAG: YihA family ribosome biogenesis GTP-binding protein [Nitrospirae bacterium]|jgi:GTP-binding protein|nr:YihA family ribosome biogenesis GTP-binding protein [Nitrospirota bacterium]